MITTALLLVSYIHTSFVTNMQGKQRIYTIETTSSYSPHYYPSASQTFRATLYPLVAMTASVPTNGSVPAPMLVMYWASLKPWLDTRYV